MMDKVQPARIPLNVGANYLRQSRTKVYDKCDKNMLSLTLFWVGGDANLHHHQLFSIFYKNAYCYEPHLLLLLVCIYLEA